jgi:drug/metabolite transporter (DMT)-like permease
MNPTLFLVAAGFFLINAVIVVSGITTGSERMTTLLGETFNAAGWAVALVGLLGLYPGVADRNRWLSRAGAVCATIGVVVFTILSLLSFAFYVRIIEGSIQNLVPLILPGVILGGVLSFLLFGISSLRTGAHSRVIGALLLVPPLIVVLNIFGGAAGFGSQYFLLGIVSGLFVVMLGIGVRLRSSSSPPHPTETTSGRTTD